MTNEYRNILTQNEFNNGLARLDKKFKWLSIRTTEKEEKRKSPRFAFLKISANAHLAHLQSHTSKPTAQALQKSAISPKHYKTS